MKALWLSGFSHYQETAERQTLWLASLPAASSLQASPWHEAFSAPEPSEQQGFNYYNVSNRGSRPSGGGETDLSSHWENKNR